MGKIYRVKDKQGNIKYPLTITDAVIDIYKDGETTKTKTVHDRLEELSEIAKTGGVTGIKFSSDGVAQKGDVLVDKSAIGLGNVENKSVSDILKDASLTGTPTAPTATSGTNTTQVATTAFVKNAIDALDKTDTAVDGQYVSKVTQTDGKIAVTRANLPDYSVTVTKKATANTNASATYTIAQAKSGLSFDIDIPKDMVVSSGTVETKTTSGAWGNAGTYLVLTLANASSDKVYINASSLIEYVTSGSKTGDMVVVDVSNDHKVTATITDGTITKAKLDSDLQSAIDDAIGSVQAIGTGTTNGTISVDGTDVPVKGLGDAAYKGVATSVSNSTDLITAKGVKDAGYTTNKGTVTSVTAGNGLSGGTITTSGTISLPTITKNSTTGTGVTGTEGTTFTAVTGITLDDYGRVTSVEKTTLTNKYRSYSTATQSSAGLMSATDKVKLDALEELTWEKVSDKEYDDATILSALSA